MDAVRLGRSIRALRRKRRWRQEDLAAAARISRGAISRVELGRAGGLTTGSLERIATALGARLVVRLEWNGEALDRLLDEVHAAAVERVVAWLGRAGWEVAVEASFNIFGERGSVDVLALHRPTGALLVVEVKSVVPDLQATLSALDRKARLGARIAGERGWAATSVSRLLVVAEDRTARRRVAAAAATFARALPDRVVAVRAFVRSPESRAPIAGLIFLTPARQVIAHHRVSRRRSGAGPDRPDTTPIP